MGFLDKLFGKKNTESSSRPPHSASPKKPQTKSNNAANLNILGRYFSLSQLNQIPMGQIHLQPIDAALVFDQQQHVVISGMFQLTPSIGKYLPNFDLSSSDKACDYFGEFMLATEFGYGFGYAIKMDNIIMGFIFVHTPEQNKKSIHFPEWSVDFCLFQPFQGKGIMTKSLSHILFFLKTKLGVSNVYAYVDESNTACLNMLPRLPFDLQPEVLTDPITGHRAKLFCCPISQIKFQR